MGIIELFPSINLLKWLSDIIIFPLFLIILLSKEIFLPKKPLFICCISLFFFSLFSFIIFSNESILIYLWGFRNTFKYFIFWWLCISYLKPEDLIIFFKILVFFIFINTPIMIYQYAVMNLFFDFIGGLQGTITGVNGAINCQLVLVSVITLALIQKEKKNYPIVILIISCCFIQATLSELKAFFLEFMIIIVSSLFFAKNRKPLILVSIASLFILSTAITYLGIFYSNTVNFFDINSILHYSQTGYGETNSMIDRSTGIPIINNMFLNTTLKHLFGIGLGAADPSIFITSNFQSVNSFWNIGFFTYAALYLGVGIIGLSLYLLFFLIILFLCKKKTDLSAIIATTLSLTSCFLIYYNSSMRLDCAIPIFAFLAFPFLRNKTLK